MLGTLFCMQKITGEVWDPQRLVILIQKSLFWMQKPKVGSIHLQRLVILVLRRCFAYTKPQERAGTHRVFYSCAKHAVMCAQNYRRGLGPIQTCTSGPKVAVLHAQNNRWGLEPMLTWYCGANHAVLHAQNDRWGLAPIETCTLVQKSMFCMQKPQMRTGTHRD